jgi:hypothetical protein
MAFVDADHEQIAEPRPLRHIQRNLIFLAEFIANRRQLMPGFRTPGGLGARLMRLAGTAARCVTVPLRGEDIAIVGPLSQFGPLKVKIQKCRYGDVLRRLGRAEPTIIVRNPNVDAGAVERLCAYIGLDAQSEVVVHVRDNPVLVVEGNVSGMPAIAHLGVGAAGRKAIQRHVHGFGVVEHAELPASIRSMVPSRLASGGSRGDVLLQSRLPGSNQSLKQMPEAEFRRHVEGVLQLVLSMRPACRQTAQGPDHEFIHQKLLQVPEMLPPEFGRHLGLARDLVKQWPSRQALPAGLVHGDLWLSNVLFDGFGKPSGLVDWEWSRANGLPVYDALYLILMALAERRGTSIDTVIPAIWDKSMRDEWLDAMLQKVGETFGLSGDDLVRSAILVWFGIIRRSAIDTTGTSSRWLEPMIRPVAERLGWYLSDRVAVH